MTRYERDPNRRSRNPASGFVVGAVIIAVGAVMLLDNLGVLRARDFWDYAPLVLVAIGVAKIFEGNGRTNTIIIGGLLSGGGMLWFLENLDVVRFDTRLVWPVLLIAFGASMLVRTLDRQRLNEGGPVPTDSQSELNVWTVFGGSKRVVDVPDFRSADLSVLFGGIDLDLRPARIVDSAFIDANAVFGGVEIRVPLTWNVELRGTGIFGGYEDKTVHPAPDPLTPAPRLVVSGYAIFGGVSISNA